MMTPKIIFQQSTKALLTFKKLIDNVFLTAIQAVCGFENVKCRSRER